MIMKPSPMFLEMVLISTCWLRMARSPSRARSLAVPVVRGAMSLRGRRRGRAKVGLVDVDSCADWVGCRALGWSWSMGGRHVSGKESDTCGSIA